MALQTQGTQLFFIDNEDGSIVEVSCPKSIGGLTEKKEQIEVTCLSDKARRYIPGLSNPGEVTIGMNFDPSDISMAKLKELRDANYTTTFIVALSDGIAPPTVTGTPPNTTVTFPTTRTYIAFEGYVSDLPLTAELNSVYELEMTLQVSGGQNWYLKTT